MLFVSLVLVVAGVYRCSSELTPSEAPGVLSVRRATVRLSDGRAVIPADSVGALATRIFVRELESAVDSRVVVGESEEAWAVVRLSVQDGTDGKIALSASARSAVGGRVLASFREEDAPETLRELATGAARSLARSMGLSGDMEGDTR